MLAQIKFEPTVSLGVLIQAVVFIITVGVAYSKVVSRMTKLEMKMNIMWSVFSRRFGVNDVRAEDNKTFFGE